MYENKNTAVDVLLVGNNPLEMSEVYNRLKNYRFGNINASITFELKGLVEKIIKLKPNSVLIDERYKTDELRKVISSLANHAKTRHIPITLIKHSNYSNVQLGADDYVMGSALTAEYLLSSIKHSPRFKKTSSLLKGLYASPRAGLFGWLRS